MNANTISVLRFLSVLAIQILPAGAGAVGWVSRHAMTGAEYQAEFDQWTQAPHNYRLISVAGYESGRQANYAAVWADEPGPNWVTHPGMTRVEYEGLAAGYARQEYYPVFLSGYGLGGQAYYNAIWHHLPGADIVSGVGLTYPAYLSEHASRTRAGYSLVHLWTFNAGTAELFTAIWRRGAPEHLAALRLTSAQHQAEFDRLIDRGYRMVAVSASVLTNTPLYSSLWKRADGLAWASEHGLTEMNYQGESWNWEYQGYRPVAASVHVAAAGPRFNLILHRNGGMLPSHLKTINDSIGAYMMDNRIPGMSVAISRHGRLLYAKGFGLADKDANEWVHPEHRFRIASVSKPITATAILKLRDHCRLGLGERVFGPGSLLGNDHGTPPYSAWEQSITVTQLLYHLTGWRRDGIWNVETSDPADAINWQLNEDVGEPQFLPGTTYDYNNTGYVVAGRIVAKLSGKTYERFVQDEILGPSCVTLMEIGAEAPEDRKPWEVVYYQNETDGDPYGLSPSRMDGNGGWIARPIDLLLFQRRIDGDPIQADIISAERVTEMRTLSGVPGSPRGLGLVVGTDRWGHSGAMNGTMAELLYRQDGYAFAVTGNYRPDDLDGRDRFQTRIKQLMNDLIDALTAADAWPDYDLFPCDIPPGDAPEVMVDPRTFYVDHTAAGCEKANGLSPICLAPLGGPFYQVNQALGVACSGDNLFIRGGSYNEKATFNRLMTIQSYNGSAVIGQ